MESNDSVFAFSVGASCINVSPVESKVLTRSLPSLYVGASCINVSPVESKVLTQSLPLSIFFSCAEEGGAEVGGGSV